MTLDTTIKIHSQSEGIFDCIYCSTTGRAMFTSLRKEPCAGIPLSRLQQVENILSETV